jgi:hypothetical protein
MAGLATAEASTVVATTTAGVVAASVLDSAGAGPAAVVTSRGRAERLAAPAAGFCSEGITTGVVGVDALSFILELLLHLAVLLGVLMTVPVTGQHSTGAQLARGVSGQLLLGTRVGVGIHVGDVDGTARHDPQCWWVGVDT